MEITTTRTTMGEKVIFFLSPRDQRSTLEFDPRTEAMSGTQKMLLTLFECFRETSSAILAAPVHSSKTSASIWSVRHLGEAVEKASTFKSSKIVFNLTSEVDHSALALATKLGVELIPWFQNTPETKWLDALACEPSVRKVVCVSNHQVTSLAAHPIRKKLRVIYNFVDTEFWKPTDVDREEAITYVGALRESKGFHHLARVWPRIRQKRPNLKLRVCGSPHMHNRDITLGEHDIADGEYERLILSFLGGTREAARMMGVEFLGGLGQQKLRECVSTSYCVVVNLNMTGSVETFCVSAAEALSMGKPVVGARSGALPEVVGHGKGGFLARNENEIVNFILNITSDDTPNLHTSVDLRQRALNSFSQQRAIEQWNALIKLGDIDMFTTEASFSQRLQYSLRKIAGALSVDLAFRPVYRMLK